MNDISLPRQTILDTTGMPAYESFIKWRELLCETMSSGLDVRQFGNLKKVAGVFKTKSQVQFVGGSGIIDSSIDQDFSFRVAHGRSEIARTPTETLYLYLQGSGSSLPVEYAGQSPNKFQVGDWTLGRTSDPHQITFSPGRTNAFTLAFPAHLTVGLRLNEDCLGRPVAADSVLNQLVANYVRTLAAGHAIPNAAGEAVIRNLLGLIALAMRSEVEASRDGVSSGMLLVLLQYLDAHYTRADLSPVHVAAHFGITTRHVHRLFERTGMTFSEQLFARRLDHAHRLLTDARPHHRFVTDIAYDSGFSDLAHFSRKYREKYGMSPSEAKRSTRTE